MIRQKRTNLFINDITKLQRLECVSILKPFIQLLTDSVTKPRFQVCFNHREALHRLDKDQVIFLIDIELLSYFKFLNLTKLNLRTAFNFLRFE